MIAADTPSRELLALAEWIEQSHSVEDYITVQIPIDQRASVVVALRLAAKPADEGVREALSQGVITACSGDGEHQIKIGFETLAKMLAARAVLNRALSPSGEPKP